MDAAPAYRLRHAGRLQPAAAQADGLRRHRGQPDPLQLGLSRLRCRRGRRRAAGHVRGGGEHGRGHAGLPGSDTHRPGVHGHERSAAVHPAGVRAGRGATPRHPLGEDHRHLESERLHLALRRQPHVPAPEPAGQPPRAGGRDRVLPAPRAQLEPGVHRRPTHAAGWCHARSGHGFRPVHRHSVRGRLPHARAAGRCVSAAVHVLLRHLDQLLRGDRQVPRRAPHLGPHRARALRLAQRACLPVQISRADFRRRPDAPAAAEQHRPRRGAGHGRHLRRHAVAAYRFLRRGVDDTDRRTVAHRHQHAEHPARGGPPDRRDRPAGRLLLRGDADRPDGGRDRGDRGADRRSGRHVRGRCCRHGAAHDRRIGTRVSGPCRERHAEDRRCECFSDR